MRRQARASTALLGAVIKVPLVRAEAGCAVGAHGGRTAMEPLSVYLPVDDRVDVVHCHKGWTLEQVRAATPHYSCSHVGRILSRVGKHPSPLALPVKARGL